MGAQTSRYENPPGYDPEKERREEELRAKYGPKRELFCDKCNTWFTIRDLVEPPRWCPCCWRPWDHQRRWRIRMEGYQGELPRLSWVERFLMLIFPERR